MNDGLVGKSDMTLYLVTYDHPDAEGWARHLLPHAGWLQDRLADGSLLASGPVVGASERTAVLILVAPDRAALDALVATDPFAIENLIADLNVREWDPIFGAFNDRSSRPGQFPAP